MPQTFSAGEDWLVYIKIDIEQKHKIAAPFFLIDGKRVESKAVCIAWICNQLSKGNWVLYKKTNIPNEFQLFATAPNPPDSICKTIVSEFINDMKDFYKTNNLIFKIGNELYSEKKVFKKLFGLVKEGSSAIYASPTSSEKTNDNNVKIVDIWFTEAEMDVQIDSGYLTLEYTE